MRILLDLDDTISIFMPTCVKVYNEIYDTRHSIEEICRWDISGIFEHSLWSIFEKTDVLQHMPLKDGALEVIREWHEKGIEIIIVTGTDNVESYADKIKWLDNVGLKAYIKDIIPTKNKYIVSGDILIDDNPSYLYCWQKENPNGLCIMMTAQHNKDKIYPFVRVDNWEQIKENVKKFQNKVDNKLI